MLTTTPLWRTGFSSSYLVASLDLPYIRNVPAAKCRRSSLADGVRHWLEWHLLAHREGFGRLAVACSLLLLPPLGEVNRYPLSVQYFVGDTRRLRRRQLRSMTTLLVLA
jgi:hypothetical protein